MFSRFNKQEIRYLLRFLDLESVAWRTRYRPSPELALCLVLVRMSFPQRLFELTLFFGRSAAYLSTVYTDTIEHLCRRYSKMLRWHPILRYQRLRQYSRAIGRAGEWRGRGTIWGFVDGTFRGTCRPEQEQQAVYSGYKKHHGFKYQAIVCPDGLIGSIMGPYEGKANDHAIVRHSGLERELQQICEGRRQLFLYGDQAYKHLDGIFGPYRGGRALSGPKKAFNKTLSSVRIAVEQAFGQTQNLWTYNAFDIQLRPGLQPVAAYYLVSVLLTNSYTCLHGQSAAGSRFLIRPPTLEEYLISD